MSPTMSPHLPGPPCGVSKKLQLVLSPRSFVVDSESVIAAKGWGILWCLVVGFTKEFDEFALPVVLIVE